MSRTKVSLYNSISAVISQIVTIISGFIVPRIMLTCYGSEINGLTTSISMFIGYFGLVEAGIASAAVYSLYKPLSENNTTGINAIISAARRFYNQSGYIMASLVACLSLVYPTFAKSTSVTVVEMRVLVLVIGSSAILEFFTLSKYRVLLTADQKLYVLSMANICFIVLNTAIIALFSRYGVNIVFLRLLCVFSVFLRSMLLYIYIKKTYTQLNFYSNQTNFSIEKRWDAFYLQMLGSIQLGAPIIIATIFTDLRTVSVYSVYNVVFSGIAGIVTIVASASFAAFGDVIARNEQSILQRAYQEFELFYYMLITWFYSCALILIMPFITLYTQGITDVDYYLPIIGILFAVNGLMHCIKTPQGMLVISAGLFRETRTQTTTQGIILLLGSIILVQFWGLPGILLGSIFSNLYRDIDLLFFIPRNLTKLRVRDSLYRILRMLICIGMTLAPYTYIEIQCANYFEWIKYATVVAIYSFVVVFIVNWVFDRSMLMVSIKRIAFVFCRN